MSSEDNEQESRSERLRRRRQTSSERSQTGESADPSQPSDSSELSEPSKPSEQSEPSEPSKPSVKEEQVGTYMYLPESQKKEIDRLYNVLKADYEFEFEEEFEKNRMFYPLLIQYGLDSLDGLDAQEVRDRLDGLYNG